METTWAGPHWAERISVAGHKAIVRRQGSWRRALFPTPKSHTRRRSSTAGRIHRPRKWTASSAPLGPVLSGAFYCAIGLGPKKGNPSAIRRFVLSGAFLCANGIGPRIGQRKRKTAFPFDSLFCANIMEKFARRRSDLRKSLRAKGRRALLVSNRSNLLYLTGFSGSDGSLVISEREAVLVTDFAT